MQVTPIHLLDDLVCLAHTDRGAEPAGLATNAYAILAPGRSLIVDAMFPYLLPSLEHLADHGHPPVAMVFTHRHLAGNGDPAMFAAFTANYEAPILLHPLDLAHPQASDTGFPFGDLTSTALVEAFGLEVIHFPGQTEGSVMLYRKRDGLLLTGDSAMGTTKLQAASGLRRLVRTPERTCVSDLQLRDGWRSFDRPISHVAPLHGTPQIGQRDIDLLIAPLVRDAATAGMSGEPVEGE